METYERGDYVKVEFPDEATGIGEWMWVRVEVCDDKRKQIIGRLDNEPINDCEGKIEQGVSWSSTTHRSESIGSRPNSQGSEALLYTARKKTSCPCSRRSVTTFTRPHLAKNGNLFADFPRDTRHRFQSPCFGLVFNQLMSAPL
jgi:hypothetical protein